MGQKPVQTFGSVFTPVFRPVLMPIIVKQEA
jgi:hypothetical protein